MWKGIDAPSQPVIESVAVDDDEQPVDKIDSTRMNVEEGTTPGSGNAINQS